MVCSELVLLSQENGKGSRERIFQRVLSLWDRCSSPIEAYYTRKPWLVF